MQKLKKFKSIVRDNNDIADFAIVYIEEGHPLDEWNITGHPYSHICQHRTIEDRFANANILASHIQNCRILVDSMENRASMLYSAVPERLYVVKNGSIVYAGGLDSYNYRLEDVEKWLSNLRNELLTARKLK